MYQVQLRRLGAQDVSELARLANNRKVWDSVRDYFPHPYEEKDAEFFIESKKDEVPQVTFAIAFEGKLAGVIGLEPQSDVYAHNAEIGYWLGEEFWGRGIATQAVKLVTSYGFKTLGVHKIYAGVFECNKGSLRVLEKAGYTREAILKDAVKKNGLIMDEIRYSIINRY